MPGSDRSGAGSRSSHSGSSSFSSHSLVGKLAKYDLKHKFYEKLDDFRQRVLLYKEPGFVVYRAKCAYSGGVVVLKGYAREALTLQTRQRIWSEVNIIQSAQCPFILKCFDSFEDQGWWWLVLENCAAGDLYHIMQSYGRISCEGWLVSQVLLPLLQTLGYLHNEGIIHRDIKPEHVLFNSEKVAKLSGFFLAQDVTKFGYPKDMVGALDYIAPEVFKLKSPQHIALAKAGLASSTYDFKVDVWMLGVLTYDVLVGEPPFCSEDPTDTVQRLMSEDPLFPEDVSDLAADFILCCLTKDPLGRPTARQLLSHPWIKANIVWVPPMGFEDPVPDMDYSYYELDDNMGGADTGHHMDDTLEGGVVWWNPMTWFQPKQAADELQDQDLTGTQQQADVMQTVKAQAGAASQAVLGFMNKLLTKHSNKVSHELPSHGSSIPVHQYDHDEERHDTQLQKQTSHTRPVSAAARVTPSRNQVAPGGTPQLCTGLSVADSTGQAEQLTPRSDLAGEISDDSEAAAPVMLRIQEKKTQQQGGIVPPIAIASIIRPSTQQQSSHASSQQQQFSHASSQRQQQGAVQEGVQGSTSVRSGQGLPASHSSQQGTPRSGRLEPLASQLTPPATGIATLPVLPAISPRDTSRDCQQQQGVQGAAPADVTQRVAPAFAPGDHILQLSARGTPPTHSQSSALPHTSLGGNGGPAPPRSLPGTPSAIAPAGMQPNTHLVPHPPLGHPSQPHISSSQPYISSAQPHISSPQLPQPVPPQMPQPQQTPHRPLTAAANLSNMGATQALLGTSPAPHPVKGAAVLRPDPAEQGWGDAGPCLTSALESLKPPSIVLKAATYSRAGTPVPTAQAGMDGQLQISSGQISSGTYVGTEANNGQETAMQQALQLMQEASHHE